MDTLHLHIIASHLTASNAPQLSTSPCARSRNCARAPHAKLSETSVKTPTLGALRVLWSRARRRASKCGITSDGAARAFVVVGETTTPHTLSHAEHLLSRWSTVDSCPPQRSQVAIPFSNQGCLLSLRQLKSPSSSRLHCRRTSGIFFLGRRLGFFLPRRWGLF